MIALLQIGLFCIGLSTSIQESKTPQPKQPNLKSAATKFIEQMSQERFDEATLTFDKTMKAAMPADKLQQTWRAVVAGAGKLQKQGAPEQSKLLQYHVVIVPCTFAKSSLRVRVVFNQQRQIAGLFFLNPVAKKPDRGSSPKAAEKDHPAVTLKTKDVVLHGTIDLPPGKGPFVIAVILAGSGPTDRDGNQQALKNDTLKQLGAKLAAAGVAALRYDKRLVGQSIVPGAKESDLRFEMYIEDAMAWIKKLRRDLRFSKVVVIGHSEGSLIGMIAARRAKADGFVSVAGAGRNAADLIREQLGKSLNKKLMEESESILKELSSGRTIMKFDAGLNLLFRESVQPYLISWFKYDPAAEIAKLNQPVLIVQGTTDIQVTEKDARLLAKANPAAELFLAPGVNHVLKHAKTTLEQTNTYTTPSTPVAPEVTEKIIDFLRKKL